MSMRQRQKVQTLLWQIIEYLNVKSCELFSVKKLFTAFLYFLYFLVGKSNFQE